MTTTARAVGKLGKLPVRTDVRTLRLRRYVDPSKLPPPPESLDLTERVAEWPMYANDRIGASSSTTRIAASATDP